jgi:hypothetical protein
MVSLTAIQPPRPIRGPAPLLTTVHEVERILRRAHAADEGPLSLAEIGRRMEAKSVRHSTLRACVDELKRLGFVTESPTKGVLWTLHEDEAFWTAKGFAKL